MSRPVTRTTSSMGERMAVHAGFSVEGECVLSLYYEDQEEFISFVNQVQDARLIPGVDDGIVAVFDGDTDYPTVFIRRTFKDLIAARGWAAECLFLPKGVLKRWVPNANRPEGSEG